MIVASLLLFLPRMFQFFGYFQQFFGFVRPIWPMLSSFFSRRHVAAV